MERLRRERRYQVMGRRDIEAKRGKVIGDLDVVLEVMEAAMVADVIIKQVGNSTSVSYFNS
jgi:hypothetical protein